MSWDFDDPFEEERAFPRYFRRRRALRVRLPQPLGRVRSRLAAPTPTYRPPAEEPEAPRPPGQPLVGEQEEKTYFRLVVLDDASGEPVPGIQLILTWGNGDQAAPVTDQYGVISYDDLEPDVLEARCELQGAVLDDTFDFVGMGKPAATPPRRGGLMPVDGNSGAGPKRCIAEIERHRVVAGDTLDSLAASVGMNLLELAWFNWGVSDPWQINQKLRDQVGCTQLAADGISYILDELCHPGIIYLPKPWKKENLSTGTLHHVRVTQADRFFVILENERGLRIPEAEYKVTFADGAGRTGRLGRGGIDVIYNPPPGPVEVVYPDLDDIKAKSLAAVARKACEDHEVSDIYWVLGHSPELVARSVAAYAEYHNDYTGQGMIEDFYFEVTDPTAVVVMETLMARAGLATHRSMKFVSWDEQAAEFEAEYGGYQERGGP